MKGNSGLGCYIKAFVAIKHNPVTEILPRCKGEKLPEQLIYNEKSSPVADNRSTNQGNTMQQEAIVTRDTFTLSCNCGHLAAISKSTNQRSDSRYWENYSCHYLIYDRDFFSYRQVHLNDAIRRLKPRCPRCRKLITDNELG